ncbi:MAG: SPOR domain-containing protein [Burkholderiales bacterium]|nr:SPOR domain-containing protein [Burkholderiales bacterium]
MAFWSKFKKNPLEDDPLLKQEPGMSSAGTEAEASAAPTSEPGFGYNASGTPASPAPQAPQPSAPPPQQAVPQTPPIRPQEEAAPPLTPPAGVARPVPAFTRRAMEKAPPRATPTRRAAYSAPSDKIADADLEYKHLRRIRARRRFVGAAMLLALVLVALPFIFDKDAPPPDQNIPLEIPNQDSAWMAIRGSSPQTMEETGREIAQEEPEAPSEPPQKVAPPPTAKATDQTPKETKPEPKPQAAPPAPEPQQAKQEQTPESKTTPKGQFFIQLVATRDVKKAEEIRKKMADAKIPCYLEKVAVKGGTAWRVRVGPFTTERSAEEARGLVGLQGYTAKVQRAS